MAIVSADEIRARLQVTDVQLSDTILNTVAFIPAGEAWFGRLATYSSLDSNQQLLAKAAIIAFICARVVTKLPAPGGKWGPVAVNDTKASDVVDLQKCFLNEAREFLREAGVSNKRRLFAFAGQGSDEIDLAIGDFT